MTWSADLTKLDTLDLSGSTLAYHLHTQWNYGPGTVMETGAGCGGDFTGGHYDPYYGCGPASAVTAENCMDLNKPKLPPTRYGDACNPTAYANHEYAGCEVGDLSSKDGLVTVDDNFEATVESLKDPLPALDYHFESLQTSDNDSAKFASIVFHDANDGFARVLCGRLFSVDDDDA